MEAQYLILNETYFHSSQSLKMKLCNSQLLPAIGRMGGEEANQAQEEVGFGSSDLQILLSLKICLYGSVLSFVSYTADAGLC